MTDEIIMKNDPHEMKIARKGSFLCEIFQAYELNIEEKQMIIKALVQDFKKKEEEKNGQGN